MSLTTSSQPPPPARSAKTTPAARGRWRSRLAKPVCRRRPQSPHMDPCTRMAAAARQRRRGDARRGRARPRAGRRAARRAREIEDRRGDSGGDATRRSPRRRRWPRDGRRTRSGEVGVGPFAPVTKLLGGSSAAAFTAITVPKRERGAGHADRGDGGRIDAPVPRCGAGTDGARKRTTTACRGTEAAGAAREPPAARRASARAPSWRPRAAGCRRRPARAPARSGSWSCRAGTTGARRRCPTASRGRRRG